MRAKEETEKSSPVRVLVISPSQENRAALHNVVMAIGLEPILCSSLSEGRKFLKGDDIRIVIFDDCLPDNGLQSIVEEMGKRPNPLPVIAASLTGEWSECMAALRVGAFDYVALPPQRDEVARVLKVALGDSFGQSGRAMTGVVHQEGAVQT